MPIQLTLLSILVETSGELDSVTKQCLVITELISLLKLNRLMVQNQVFYQLHHAPVPMKTGHQPSSHQSHLLQQPLQQLNHPLFQQLPPQQLEQPMLQHLLSLHQQHHRHHNVKASQKIPNVSGLVNQ
jgi:hypothetical protein